MTDRIPSDGVVCDLDHTKGVVVNSGIAAIQTQVHTVITIYHGGDHGLIDKLLQADRPVELPNDLFGRFELLHLIAPRLTAVGQLVLSVDVSNQSSVGGTKDVVFVDEEVNVLIERPHVGQTGVDASQQLSQPVNCQLRAGAAGRKLDAPEFLVVVVLLHCRQQKL